MSQAINALLFGIYPYICLTVFLIGSLIRFDREQYTWRSQSSQLLRRRQLIWGSNLFHVGILVILFGHTGGLLTPVVVSLRKPVPLTVMAVPPDRLPESVKVPALTVVAPL